MRLALVNGERQEAQPSQEGRCPSCASPVIAKCGELRIRHWAHKGRQHCDPWWENETEWHRAWKSQFPLHWQEVVHSAANGERHIADVKTDRGWVLEFQHSYIKPEERRSREAFYSKLMWVLDGTRRKRDRAKFLEAWKSGVPVNGNAALRRTLSDECSLLKEWEGDLPVFFDFGEEQVIWWLLSGGLGGAVYLAPFSRANFIAIHRCGQTQSAQEFDAFVNDIRKLVTDYESHHRVQAQPAFPGFHLYSTRRRAFRRF
jgi:hypothetical protein